MQKIAELVARGLLLIFSAIVLGLSITLAKHQLVGSPPAETSFGSFCGAFGILMNLVGLATLLTDKIPAIVLSIGDGLVAGLYLAGGIALTIALEPVSSCTATDLKNRYARYHNKLLTGGCQDVAGRNICPGITEESVLVGRCQRVQADFVFEYLAFAAAVAVVALNISMRRSKSSTTVNYA